VPSSGGEYSISLTVSDGLFTMYQNFTVIVPMPPNHPPAIANATVPDAWTDVPFTYIIQAADVDGDPLTFTLGTTAESISVDPHSGQLNWTPHTAGTFPVSVTISDGKDGIVFNFNITVRQSNRLPMLTGTPPATGTVDVQYSFTPNASDADGDALTFSKESAPANLTVNPSTGVVAWTPDAAGTFPVVLKVSDGKGGEASLRFNITVGAATRPVITYSGPSAGQKVKGTLTLTGNVTKGTRDVKKVQVKIDGGNWTDATGTSSWSFTVDTSSLTKGSHTFTVRAFDGKDYSDQAKVDLNIDNTKAAKPAPSKGFIPMMDGGLAIALAAAGMALIMLRRRKMA
jgi:hypothetical protein